MAKKRAKRRAQAKRLTPKLARDAEYDQPGLEFLRILAVGLDLSLREAKITDVKTRRRVVDDFCWGTAEFLDHQWFETADGQRHFPIVCFADRHLDEDPQVLRMPEMTYFHEMIPDVFNEVTNKGKGPYQVTIGELGDDDPIDLDEE
jgi:hypothetical protein